MFLQITSAPATDSQTEIVHSAQPKDDPQIHSHTQL